MLSSQVKVAEGVLAGARSDSGITSFKGVPFAAPPLGDLRWRPPQPMDPWSGTRAAQTFGDDCMQAPGVYLRGAARSEDCLTLNVWTPAKSEGERLPVMVWIPGGGFVGGSGSDARADGEALAKKGVVVVTCNYRTGLFGWLAHPDLQAESPFKAAGNYGLMDQAAALAWVQKNIGAFGGDPKRVTVFGVSAGGAAIALLMMSPIARGLFHQVILESSGAFRPLARLGESMEAGLTLGGSIKDLRGLTTEELFALTGRLVPQMRGLTTPRILRPICDGVLVPDDDRPAFLSGAFARVPMIVGSNVDEGTNFTKDWPINTKAEFADLLKREFGDMAALAARYYPVASDADVKPQLANVFGDTQFNYGAWGISRVGRDFGLPVYRYLFSHRPGGRKSDIRHGEEVSFVFGNPGTAIFEDGAQGAGDAAVAGNVMEAWASFAKHGVPTLAQGPEWPLYDEIQDNMMNLAAPAGITEGWRAEQMQFIDEFFEARAGKA